MRGGRPAGDRVPITFVIDRFSTTGAGTEGQLHLLLQGLSNEGYSPVLFVLDGTDLVKAEEFSYPVYVVGRSSIKSSASWWRLMKVAWSERRRGSRVVHCFFNDCSVLCPPIFALFGFKVFISRRDMGFWYNAAYLRLLNVTRRFVDGVVVNSQAVGDVTKVKEGYVQDKIHLIYNAYSKNQTESPECVLSGLDFRPSQGLRLVLVANLRSIKRIGDAITAVSKLLAQNCPAQLFVVGAGDPSELKALAEQLEVQERVCFLGSRNDVAAILRSMDVGLNCSESEGYSNAIVEYMYAGLPVVASNAGGNSEAVIDEMTGFLYPVADVDQLTNRILFLARDDQRRIEMGQKGQEIASTRHSPESVVSQYAELYEGVAVSNVLGPAPDREL